MPTQKPIHLLIVDDDPGTRKTLTDILTHKGYSVTAVARGKTALKRARKKPPTVALIDLKLQDISGLEVLQGIKDFSLTTECILLTGYATQEAAIQALNQGAYSFLVKPYDMDILLNTIQQAAKKVEAELALRASEEHYRQLYAEAERLREFSDRILETMGEAVILEDLDGTITFVNQIAQQWLGYSAEELLGQHWTVVVPPEERMHVADEFAKRPEGIASVYESRLLTKDGRSIPVQVSATPFWLGGRVTGVLATFSDLTARKQAEEELKKAAEEWSLTFNTMTDMVTIHDRDFRIRRANQAVASTFGISPEEIVGKHCYEIFHATDGPIEECPLQATKCSGKMETTERWEPTIDRWISFCTNPIFDTTGELLGAVHVMSDITERMQAEEELRQLNRRLERRNQELLAIQEVAQKLISTLDLQEIFWTMYQEIGEKILHSPHFNIARYDPQTQLITCEFAIVDGQEHDPAEFPPMPLSEGPMSETIHNRQARVVDIEAIRPALEAKGRIAQIGDKRRTKSALYVPLISRGEVFGVMNVQSYEPNAYDETDLELLTTLANQASVAIQNARLFIQLETRLEEVQRAQAALQRQAEEWRGLHEISKAFQKVTNIKETLGTLTRQIATLLNASVCVIGLLDTERGEIVGQIPGYGVPYEKLAFLRYPVQLGGEVWDLLQKGPFLGNSLEAIPEELRNLARYFAIQSLLVAPMTSLEGELEGVIFVANKPGGFEKNDLLLLNLLASQAKVVIEKARLFELSQRQLRDLSVLNKAAMAGVEALSEDELLHRVTNIIGEILYPDHFGILLVDEQAGRLKIHPSYRGISEEHRRTIIPLGKGVAGKVAATGEPILLGDVSDDPDYIATTKGIQSELCVPIKTGERVLGVINAESKQLNAFTSQDEQLLTTLAGQLATALEEVRLLEATRRQARELSTLYSISLATSQILNLDELLDQVYTQINTLIHPDSILITLAHPEREEFEVVLAMEEGRSVEEFLGRRLPFDQGGLTGWVLKEQKSLLVRDMEHDPLPVTPIHGNRPVRSWLGVPMIFGGRLLGAITIQSFRPEAFDENQRQFLQSLASQLAVALENVRLFQAEQRRAARLEEILATIAELSTFREEQPLLDGLVERMFQMADSLTCTALTIDKTTNEAVLQAYVGLPEDTPANLRIPLQLPILKEFLEQKEPIILEDVDREAPEMRQLLLNPKVRALCIYPLVAEGEMLGAITLSHSHVHRPSSAEKNAFRLLAERTAAALVNIRLYQAERRRAEVNAAILATNQALTSLDLDEVLHTIASQVKELMRGDGSRIHLVDEDGERLRCVVALHHRAEEVKRITPRIGEGITGRVAKTGTPEIIPNTLEDKNAIHVPGTPVEAESLIVTPLIFRHQVIGVMTVSRLGSEHPFTEDDRRLLTGFANQAVLAIEKARLFQAEQQRSQELAVLSKVSTSMRSAHNVEEILPILLKEAGGIIQAPFGSIYLAEPDTGDLVCRCWFPHSPELIGQRHKRGEGITGYVAQTSEIYTTSNLLDDPLVQTLPGEDRQISQWRSSISLPLRTEDAVVGVMHIGTPEKREFSPEEIRLLTAIADMGATAIHRADLHDRTESQVQRLNALHTIDQAISSSVDMSLTLKVVLNQVTSVLHADAADVLLHRPKSRMLELEAAKGFRDPKTSRPRERLGEGLAGKVALERKITQIEDLRSSEDVPPGIVEQEGFNSYVGVPLVAKGQIKGVLEIFHRSPLRPSSDWMGFLGQLADQTAVAIDNAQLFTNLQHSTIQLEMAYNTTLEGWALALELRDQETEGHSKRVTDLTIRVAEAMGISGEELIHIRRGALLHDIGKMGVPDHILLKPGKLNEEEWEIMRQHPEMAYRLLSHIPFLRPALDIPRFHHERWDGSGYPMGLRGEAIPLAARIFAVVDVWDALRSDRPYRKAWTDEQAVTYLREQAGVLFDPQVVEVFLSLIGK